jgi:hypothetical protein
MKHSGFYVGGLLIFCGAFALLRYHTRRDKITGLTYKQFVWCCVIAILGGAMTVIAELFQ